MICRISTVIRVFVADLVLDLSKHYHEFWDDDAQQKVTDFLDEFWNFYQAPDDYEVETYMFLYGELCNDSTSLEIDTLLYNCYLALFADINLFLYSPCNSIYMIRFIGSRNLQCMRSRCQYCGAVRAKNSTRQYEHLQQCSAFLNSSEGQRALADGAIQPMPAGSNGGGNNDIFTGTYKQDALQLLKPLPWP